MTITKSNKSVILLFVFLIVLVAVMAISMLIKASSAQAHGIPEQIIQHAVAAKLEQVTVVEYADYSEVVDGLASWYGPGFHGRRTASGSKYDMHAMTAAHKTLPFGTLLKVVNPLNGKTIIVEVTDRGPFIRKRVVDLSYAAAKELGVSVTPVELDALTPTDIANFYVENDSVVLVMTGSMEIMKRSMSTLTISDNVQSFTKALSGMLENEVLVIRLNEKGKLVCCRAVVEENQFASVIEASN
ncbi:MAG: septal ring lytic transglycosylase RlpA family protein [Ignavibacteria bacterium]|nr:septal ring lytic transglycosylase RlpA family protein [Ignavibacteria bacterium]